MNRFWVVAVSALSVSVVARGEDVNWLPAPSAPAAVPAPTPSPTSPPRPPAPARTEVDAPEFRAVPTTGPSAPLLPAPPVVVPPQPSAPPPARLPDPPREVLPSRLPTLAIPEISVADDKPDSKPAPKSESLPPPRPAPADPEKPKPDAPAWTVTPAAGVCPPDTRPALEPAPNLPAAGGGVPARGKTFGSPPIRLSRDFALRDVFGYDLASPKAGVNRAEPVVPAADAAPGPADFFVETEYLLWWANRPRIPLLATTTDGTGTGFVGQPGTRNLLGPGTFGPSFRDGFRVRAGAWLDDCGGHGIDGSFFFLGRRTDSVAFTGLPTLTRPFFAPNFNSEFGEVVALPNLSTGTLTVSTDSFLWGADANYRCAICRTCDRTTAWFAGYRHLNLTETLTITENITASGPLANDPVGTKVVVQDQFRTYNRFHGGQVGWLSSQKYGRWELDLRASVALGVNVQTLEIDGFQQRTRPGQATDSFRGGLLATGPNLGQFNQSRFSVAPEATVTLGYAVTPRLRLMAGYNFLYWSNVIRPGDQIDRTIDVTLVPNPPAGVAASGQNRPQPLFRQSDFWTQGISFGAQLRW